MVFYLGNEPDRQPLTFNNAIIEKANQTKLLGVGWNYPLDKQEGTQKALLFSFPKRLGFKQINH